MKLPQAREGMTVMEIFVSVINYLRANTIRNVIGGKLRRSPSGITIEIERAKTTKKPAPKTFPLEPVRSGDDKVKFRWGTVNGLTPKIGEVEITAGIDEDVNPLLTITQSGIIYVKVDVAASTLVINNPVLLFGTTVPADTSTAAHRALVNVTWNAGDSVISAIAPSHRGSIEVATCGGVLYYWDLGQTNDIYYEYYNEEMF
jgi:hypothetical protein